jgi:uncharacterized protein YyaL (SSP411 family)
MRYRFSFVYLVVAATLLASTAVARAASPAEIRWYGDPAEAHQLARQHERPLLLLLTTEGCFYCSKMKESTYRDQQVATDISKHFVAAQVDAKQHPVLAKKLGVKVYPTTVIISPDFKVMDVIRGYVDAKKLRLRMASAAGRVRVARADAGTESQALR